MCTVDPNNIPMLRAIGYFLFIYVVLSIIVGKTYARTLIIKAEQPRLFWCMMILFLALGFMMVVGTHVCDVKMPNQLHP